MKKSLSILSWMFMMLFAISFTGCSEDDDDDSASNGNGMNWNVNTGGSETSSIVGSWIYSDEYGYDIITFKSDGTGTWRFVEYEYPDLNEEETFTYVYSNGTVTAIFGDEVETFPAVFVGGKLVLDGDIYEAYTGTIPDNGNTNGDNLVGTWKFIWGTDGSYSTMLFRSDGTGVYTEIDYESESYSENFTYSYHAPVLTLYWTEDGYTENITLTFISDNKISVEFEDEDEMNGIWTRN